MPFNDLTDTQRKFLAAHTKSGKALAQAAPVPVDPHKEARTAWLAKVFTLQDRISAAPPALDTSKIDMALDKTKRIYEADFDPVLAEKALNTIRAAFDKATASSGGNAASATVLHSTVAADFAALKKLAFPEKKTISDAISNLLATAKSKIKTGDFQDAERLISNAETTIASARIGVDANAAKDLKPADLKVLMKTKDGQAQLDAIVNNLTDDVPPNVMMSILEARFSLDRKIFQNAADREGSMLDKAKHGAMLDTDSPKLKKFYKKLMDKQAAEKDQEN